MKTFREFQTEAVAALAAPMIGAGVRAAAPIVVGGAAKLFQGMMQASKDRATPRTPNLQRPSPKVTAAETQKRQAAADRRADARARADAKVQSGIDSLIGSDAERKAAAQARANQPQIQKDLRRKATRDRMSQAADRLGLPEQMTAPKLMTRGLDLRTTKEKQKEIKIEADLLPYNPSIGDRYKTH